MKITHHGQYLVQLTRYAAVFPMNCYLVREEDGLTLVDSTASSPGPDVARVASELGLTLRRIALHVRQLGQGGNRVLYAQPSGPLRRDVPELASRPALCVEEVSPNSAAAKAGASPFSTASPTARKISGVLS